MHPPPPPPKKKTIFFLFFFLGGGGVKIIKFCLTQQSVNMTTCLCVSKNTRIMSEQQEMFFYSRLEKNGDQEGQHYCKLFTVVLNSNETS